MIPFLVLVNIASIFILNLNLILLNNLLIYLLYKYFLNIQSFLTNCKVFPLKNLLTTVTMRSLGRLEWRLSLLLAVVDDYFPL
ncbi:hypothetical protein BpHYR1_046711 [Brachionus plicatilis]|uniref:Uncharacterized protein n=1 Tax=Brachionus plicatilis TaxID=10195 RepID=A0A3M7PML2_BRAPC|nr:hypothetical protein BpHYR1_046711 [Brachionus plicatilis]